MDNSMDAVDASLREHWEGETDEDVYALILPAWERSILPTLKENTAAIDNSVDDFRGRWIRSMRLTIDLFQALHNNWYSADSAEKPSYFWIHQTYDFLRANDATRGLDINKAELLE